MVQVFPCIMLELQFFTFSAGRHHYCGPSSCSCYYAVAYAHAYVCNHDLCLATCICEKECVVAKRFEKRL